MAANGRIARACRRTTVCCQNQRVMDEAQMYSPRHPASLKLRRDLRAAGYPGSFLRSPPSLFSASEKSHRSFSEGGHWRRRIKYCQMAFFGLTRKFHKICQCADFSLTYIYRPVAPHYLNVEAPPAYAGGIFFFASAKQNSRYPSPPFRVGNSAKAG